MKKRYLVGFTSMLLLLAACGEVPPEVAKDFYLTGDLNLNGETALKLTKEGNDYVLNNLSLKRGDSFLVYSNDDRVGFEDLANPKGFEEGNNSYIKVLNEGVYNLTLSEEELTLTKTDSTYKNVKLVFESDEKEVTFTKNEDFSFSLFDVDLRYREKFHIELDDEVLTYDALSYNDTYCDALRFDSTDIETIQKGLFDFTIDFNNANPLTIFSDSLKMPNQIPFDAESYMKVTALLDDQFNAVGSKLTVKEKITKGETTTEKEHLQTLNHNEAYYEVKDLSTEVVSKSSRMIDDVNYFELKTYENSTTAPSVSGKLLGEAPSETQEDEESTIVTMEKEYISLEKAKENIVGFAGFDNTLKGYLNNVVNVTHISSPATSMVSNYGNTLQLEAEYTSDVGDALKIVAYNEEFKNSSTDDFVKNEVELNLDNNGHLTSGKVSVIFYKGSNILDDENKLKEDAVVQEERLYEFNYEYEERAELEEYSIDYEALIATEITCLETVDVDCGDTLSLDDQLSILTFEPSTAKDTKNYKIIQYDSTYISAGYASFTANNAGTTEVVIGNTYNDVTTTIELTISYKATTRISEISSTNGASTFFVGSTYEFKVAVPSYSDPVVNITVSDPEYLEIVSIDDEATMKKNQKAIFKVKMLKETTESVSITATSKNYPSATLSKKIDILKPFTKAEVAGTYKYYSYTNNYFTLNADGTGEAKDNNLNVHTFTYDIIEGNKLSLVASDTLTKISGTFAYADKSLNAIKITSLSIQNSDGSLGGFGSSTYTRELSIYQNEYTTADGKKLTFSNIKYDYNGQYADLLISDGTTNYVECTWAPFAYTKVSGCKIEGSSAYSVTITVTNLTDTSFTMEIKKSSTVYATYEFTKVTAQ